MTQKRFLFLLLAVAIIAAALLLLRQHSAGARLVAEFDAALRAADDRAAPTGCSGAPPQAAAVCERRLNQ